MIDPNHELAITTDATMPAREVTNALRGDQHGSYCTPRCLADDNCRPAEQYESQR